ncbi:atherin-like [Astyanax mexicanus]|uniref:Atherin-like n=2 Tax=Astyanax mexicanus TaxID=7994 RepID=A0A8T2KYG7_ASTMX|nr:atherin-like [Astyanax mexicanus]
MSNLRYRDWILDTIDSLRSRKARPDLERICRMVRRRHGSDPERTRAELERLIQERAVLKVSYKGSTSYRNAARVQRKGRRTTADQTTDSTDNNKLELSLRDRERSNSGGSSSSGSNGNGDSSSCNGNDEQSSNNNNQSTSGSTHAEREPTRSCGKSLCKSCTSICTCTSTSTSARAPSVAPATPDPRREQTSCSEKQQQHCVLVKSECGGGVKHGGGGFTGTCDGRDGADAGADVGACSTRVDGGKQGAGSSISKSAAVNGGGSHAPLGPREVLGCLSAHEQLETLTRHRARALESSTGSRNSSRRRKRRMMMVVVEMKKKSRTTEASAAAAAAARALGQAGSRLCKAMKRRKRMKGGGGARDDQSKDEEKDDETMETESEEEEDAEEEVEEEQEKMEGDDLSPVCHQTTKTEEGSPGVPGLNPGPLSSLEKKSSNVDQRVMMSAENLQPLLLAASSSLSSSPSPSSPSRQDADSECGRVNQVATVGTGDLQEEERSATPNQLQFNTQTLSVMVTDSVRIPSSIPIKSYSGCKTEVGMSSCLLTPSASPGAAEERGMNGGMFVKTESSVVNPVDWTVSDVANYFTAVGFPEQALAFRTQEIDGKSLLLMQRNDVLTGLSIRLGPALKIYERHVKVLQRTHFQDDGAFC